MTNCIDDDLQPLRRAESDFYDFLTLIISDYDQWRLMIDATEFIDEEDATKAVISLPDEFGIVNTIVFTLQEI